MPKLRPLGRYDAALSMISASRARETSTARKILALLAPLDDIEADNALDLVEEVLNRGEEDAVQEIISRRASHAQQLDLVDADYTTGQSPV